MKKKKDLRVEICKSLEGKKKFNLYWTEETNCAYTGIEAHNEEEVRQKFFNGEINADVEEGDINFVEGSLEIEEAEE